MSKYAVGLDVFYLKGMGDERRASLVAHIGEDPGNPGSEEWWAWMDVTNGHLGRVSVGKYWMPDEAAEKAAKKKQETEIERLKRVSALLYGALVGLGKVKQFKDQLCWCQTLDGTYCVGQPECKDAQTALAAFEAPKEKKA